MLRPDDAGLAEWLAFRLDSLTETYGRLRELVGDDAEVTVIAVCLELQKSQKTSPEKRHA